MGEERALASKEWAEWKISWTKEGCLWICGGDGVIQSEALMEGGQEIRLKSIDPSFSWVS